MSIGRVVAVAGDWQNTNQFNTTPDWPAEGMKSPGLPGVHDAYGVKPTGELRRNSRSSRAEPHLWADLNRWGYNGVGEINCSLETSISAPAPLSDFRNIAVLFPLRRTLKFHSIQQQIRNMSTTSGQHIAAVLPSKGHALEVDLRPTPTPGPTDLLIEVKSIALNPIDYYMRDMGFVIASYPAIVGSDIAGVVVSAGDSVPFDAPKPGTRVAAFAPCFFTKGAPDYGAFQEKVLVPASNVTTLPESLSFNEASILPMAVVTAWSGWYSIGIPRDTKYTAADKKGMLVWGGASSVGSAAIQTAKLLGFTVYATASRKHHEYLKTLGAHKVFDYKDDDVADKIVKAVKADGVTLTTAYDAVGQLQTCLDVLKELKGEGPSKLASAVPLREDSPKVEGVEVKFVMAPNGDEARSDHFHFVMGEWLKEKLESGEYKPSPKIQVVDGGLPGINDALDVLKGRVSGVKLVVEVDKS